MKIMKRLIPVLMCLALAVAIVVITTNQSTADSAAHISIQVDAPEQLYVGDTIQVTFKAERDKAVTTLTGGIRFDSSYLKCTGVTLAEANGHKLLTPVELKPDAQNENYRMVGVSTPDEANSVGQAGFYSVGTNEVSYGATNLFVATFEVLKVGTFDVIGYEDSYVGINADEVQKVTLTAVEKPAVTGLKGDVTLNGEVDMDDVVALMQHVLMAEVITDTTSLANGEVTNDTSLDMDDVVKLMQYVLKAIDSLD